MTTSEALDLLARLSDPALAAKAEKDASRPLDRFKGRHFKADIPQQELEVISRRIGNSQFDSWGMFLKVDITEVYEGNVEPGEHTIWIRAANPFTRDGKENKRTQHSELLQMAAASGNPRSWPGKKDVEFTEDTHDYITRKDTKLPDLNEDGTQKRNADGSPRTIWADEPAEVWFYKLNFRGGSSTASTNGAAPTTVSQPTDAAVARALEMIKEAGSDGIKEVEFNLACTKDPVVKADKAMPKYLTEGKLVSDNPDKVLRDGALLVWVGGE